ncbi:hypothetical protein FSB78_10950 [Sphingomonas ginsenosidivorax]|uniref:Uncharacterized protein n=1 Tax=Sphingomonas ginsenosidivorax TaxID=862135 RepID=A0A5C6UHE7_9SPHN|nr:hypothetical protein FSB78_10950 [Sphingomonas ginsenosidivorax]
MFEENAIWTRTELDSVAVRYLGFRNLETAQVWIANGNYVSINDQEGEPHNLTADQQISANSVLESFLNDLPSNTHAWKATIAEAIEYFQNNESGVN